MTDNRQANREYWLSKAAKAASFRPAEIRQMAVMTYRHLAGCEKAHSTVVSRDKNKPLCEENW